MNKVLAQRVAWRRRNVPHHYVGTLSLSDGGIRLVGREPATGIELALSIPFDEIEDVRASGSADEAVVGERAVVIDLAGSESILLREIGVGQPRPGELATRLASLAPRARPPRRAATASR